jgi:hypothetical protein
MALHSAPRGQGGENMQVWIATMVHQGRNSGIPVFKGIGRCFDSRWQSRRAEPIEVDRNSFLTLKDEVASEQVLIRRGAGIVSLAARVKDAVGRG